MNSDRMQGGTEMHTPTKEGPLAGPADSHRFAHSDGRAEHVEEHYFSAGELSPTASEAHASDRSPTASEGFEVSTPLSLAAPHVTAFNPDPIEEVVEDFVLHDPGVTGGMEIGSSAQVVSPSVAVKPMGTSLVFSDVEHEMVEIDLGSGRFEKETGLANFTGDNALNALPIIEDEGQLEHKSESVPTSSDAVNAPRVLSSEPRRADEPPVLRASSIALQNGRVEALSTQPAPVVKKEEQQPAALSQDPVPEAHPQGQATAGSLEDRAERKSSEGIPFFVVVDGAKKPATLSNSMSAIDFNLPGLSISSFDFVGLRYLDPASLKALLSSTSSILDSINTAGQKLTDMITGSAQKMLSALPAPNKTRFNGTTPRQPASPVQQQDRQGKEGTEGSSKASSKQSATTRPRRHSYPGHERNGHDGEMQWWEILWKDHNKHNQNNPTGSLRRLQFQTTDAGYQLVRDQVQRWSMAALGNSGMTEAAHAALEAKAMSPKAGLASPSNGDRDKASWHLPALPDLSGPALFTKPRRWKSTIGGPAGARKEKAVLSDDSQHGPQSPPDQSPTRTGDWVEVASPSIGRAGSGEGVTLSLVAGPSGASYQHGYQHVIVPGAVGEQEAQPGSPAPAEPKPGLPMVEGKYLPNMNPHSHLLQQPHIRALAASLPTRYRLSSWNLIYSTWRDGISLQTLYRKAFKRGSSLVIVSDRRHHVFGCFASEDWKVHPRYFGNGECFVFTLYPEMRVFRWTRANSYFMFGTPDSIHMGGGSHFALSLDGDLMHGSSGSCETFGNVNLASSEEFEILHVEVWGFK